MRAKEERLRGCGGLDGPGYTTHAGHGLEDSRHARQNRMGMPVAVARILVHAVMNISGSYRVFCCRLLRDLTRDLQRPGSINYQPGRDQFGLARATLVAGVFSPVRVDNRIGR